MTLFMVMLGGALGAASRYVLLQLLPPVSQGFPWATWLANIMGSLFIGLCYAIIIDKGLVAEHWRPLLMIGFLGAFTTFSSFALEAVILWQTGSVQVALVYVVSSVFVCIFCAAGSIWLINKLF
jgi:fluoride exporter